MADTVIETTEIPTETLTIVIVRHVVGMTRIAIVMEGTVETGEIVGVHHQSMEVVEDIPLNIVAEEAIQGVHRGEEALAVTETQTVRVVLVNLQQIVQIHVGEVDPIVGAENHRWFDTPK